VNRTGIPLYMFARAGRQRGMTRQEAFDRIQELEPEATPEAIDRALNRYYEQAAKNGGR
jgi:hypothetical protein